LSLFISFSERFFFAPIPMHLFIFHLLHFFLSDFSFVFLYFRKKSALSHTVSQELL
jgi:hypothetical protein